MHPIMLHRQIASPKNMDIDRDFDVMSQTIDKFRIKNKSKQN